MYSLLIQNAWQGKEGAWGKDDHKLFDGLLSLVAIYIHTHYIVATQQALLRAQVDKDRERGKGRDKQMGDCGKNKETKGVLVDEYISYYIFTYIPLMPS